MYNGFVFFYDRVQQITKTYEFTFKIRF